MLTNYQNHQPPKRRTNRPLSPLMMSIRLYIQAICIQNRTLPAASAKLPYLLQAATLAALGAYSTAALAEDKPSVELAPIVVTASAFEPQAGDMATATSVITQSQIMQQGKSTLGDALANEPGVNSDTFGQGATRPIIRGQTAPRVQVAQNGMLVQDASQISPDHQVSVPVLGAKQIEVIKGSSALMYGGGAIGGVVNVVDDTIPSEPMNDTVSGQFGLIGQQTTDGYLGYAQLNGKLNDNWQWTGRFQKTDLDDVKVPKSRYDKVKNSWYKQDNASVGFAYVNEFDYVGFSYQRQDSDYGLPFHVHNHCQPDEHRINRLTCGLDEHEHGAHEHHDHGEHEHEKHGHTEHEHGHNEHEEHEHGHDEHGHEEHGHQEHEHGHEEHDHDEHEHHHEHGELPYVKLKSDVYQIQTEHLVPLTGIDKLATRFSYTDYQHDEIDEGVVGTIFKNKAFGATVQATHATHQVGNLGYMKGIIGVDYANSKFSAEGLEAYLPKTRRNQVGTYIIERLTPTYSGAQINDAGRLGAQSSKTQQDHRGHNHGSSTLPTDSTAAKLAKQGKDLWYVQFGGRQDIQKIEDMDNNISKSDNAHSLSLEAGRYLTPTTQVSARVSHSERLPASQELYANGAHLATNTWERGNLQLDKESTDGIELSLRYDNNKNFDLSTSVFYNDTDDYIYAKTQDLVTDGESKGFRLVDYHQSDAKHYGGEIKARYYLNDYISIGGFSDIAIIELKDKQLGSKYAPRLAAPRVGGDITAQFNQFDVVLSGYHRYEQNKVAEFEHTTPSYNMVDAKVTYHSAGPQDYTAFLQVSNLLNDLAYNHSSYLVEHMPLAERSFNAGITYRF
ncbi:TonB-dependent receptor [Psychrobacter raelei]|uniref:TonB-dependent receptor n=1 Tax=Psychrobacter raelei TaxID=2565531 RepID=A0AAT9PDX4_9GAMM